MDDLVLHGATRTQLEALVRTPPQAILLAGPDGAGKTTVATALAASLLELRSQDLASYPYFLAIRPEGASISIEAIRSLQKFLQLKSTGSNTLRRAVIIESSHALTAEAQNAYLKLLEEPPADTVMILTATTPRALLQTILSRLQVVTVRAPSKDDLQPLLAASQKTAEEKNQAYLLSGGLPGLLVALLGDEQAHPLLASVAHAKQVLAGTPFERLALVEQLSKQKEDAARLTEALERIAQAGMQGAAARSDTSKIRQWHRVRVCALAARQSLEKSGNAKLTLTNLFLQMG